MEAWQSITHVHKCDMCEHHSIVTPLMYMPARQAFLERIEGWVKKLTSMQDIFDSWLTCQQKWMYLGPVYGSEEIAKQMPKERFEFQVRHTEGS